MNGLCKIALLMSFLLLSGCSVLWGPSDTVSNWPFENSVEKNLTLRKGEEIFGAYPKSFKLSKGPDGLVWQAKYSNDDLTDEEVSGPGNIKLLRIENGAKIYGFSAAFDSKKYPNNPERFAELNGGAVFGLLTIKGPDDSYYRLSLIRCGDSEKIKQCETKTSEEAWEILSSIGSKRDGRVEYVEYEIDKPLN